MPTNPTPLVTIEKAEKMLKEQLSSSHSVALTVGDMATLTGLNTDDAKHALDAMMAKYICRLKVTEAGDLIYDFGSSLLRRGKKNFKEYLEDAQDFLWKVFQVFYRAWIAITLVFYFVIFLIVIIGIIIAALAGDGDGDFDGGDLFAGIFHAMIEMFRMILIWDTFNHTTYYATDQYGYQYKHYETKKSSWGKLKKKKNKNGEIALEAEESKSFVISVYDFVFGPARVQRTPLDNLKEVAAYSRKQNGIVVTPEIMGLTGYTADEADKIMVEAMTRFDGKAEITEKGVLYGNFEELSRSANQPTNEQIEWYWDEYEPDYEITGNTSGRNAGIIAMNVFNLVVATGVIGVTAANPDLPTWLSVGFGWIPLAFSTTFFCLPIFRSFSIAAKRKKRHLLNIRKRVMKVIYQDQSAEVPLAQIRLAVDSYKGKEKLAEKDIEKAINEVVFDFEGEMIIKEDATVVYRFDKLRAEVLEAERLRKEKGFANQTPNHVIFDSGI
jgi:hypothetical protein